ncbi:class I SAM-dependent methyltransferase [Alphaproteobacteria bacterium]|nr:class I SAM-dependent methyltransferase [Alphaproteobacteria bacterium]
MESLTTLIKNNIKSDFIKQSLKSLFYLIFDRNLYKAHKSYEFTDEQLKFTHILESINYIRIAELPNSYFEFGCHSARTFSAAARAARYLKMRDMEFYAFDSFEGLPEVVKKDDGFFKTSSFYTNMPDFLRLLKKNSGLELPKSNCIKGYYKESLTSKLLSKLPKAGVVHIDVDLYSSTVEVLKFIKPLLVCGTVLIFDDWYCFPPSESKGEKRAFEEFCADHPNFKTEVWKNYSTFGKSFFVTSLP